MVLSCALFAATATAGASSPPTVRQVASIVAAHQPALASTAHLS